MSLLFRRLGLGGLAITIIALSIGSDNSYGITRKPKLEISSAALEKQIHDLINKERQRHGQSSLNWNKTLHMIARKHSRDMAQRSYFSHNSPEGHDFLERYKEEGFTCAIHIGNYIHQGAENIARNTLYDSVTYVNEVAYYNWKTQDEIAESIVQGWMQSPRHRENILTAHWETEGIGIFISDEGTIFITQNFC